MNPVVPPGPGPQGHVRTLGDLIYANGTRPLVTEAEWVALVRSTAGGDQRALNLLFDRMHRVVFTLIVRITNNRQTAEELTVDVFHDVWRRAAAYDPAGGPVVGWIMNQARSRAIDRVRFEQRKKRVGSSEGSPLTTTTSDPHEMLDLKEEGRRVRQALAILTADERQAVETAFFAEMTYHEVATRLGQPLGTVKTRIRSALSKLRQALAGTGER